MPSMRTVRTTPPPPGKKSERHLGQAELRLRIVDRDAAVAGERDLEPAAERRAVERRDDRLAERLERAQVTLGLFDRVEDRLGAVRLRLDEQREIAAGEEGLLRRGDDHAFDRVFLGDEPRYRRASATLVERVHRVRRLIRVVDGEGDDAVVVLVPADGGLFGGHGLLALRKKFRDASDAFDDGGDAHAAADAQRGQGALQVAALELVERGAEDHRAGRAERVPHGDGAAVDVHDLVRDLHVLHEAHGDRGERLVDFVEVDLFLLEACLRERLPGGGHGAGEHDRGVGAGDGGGDDARARRESELFAGAFGADQHERRAVDDARRVAGGVHVSMRSTQWYFCSATALKPPISPIISNDGGELGERFHRRVGPDELVLGEDGQAVAILDRERRTS